MKPVTKYIRYTQFMLLFIFIVILAGGIVRTTQSGMGCPDWPKCFGMWIPPTSAKDLPPDYQKYLSKQDIDKLYNPVHAWIEWLNRQTTGILGFLMIIHVIWSYVRFYKTKRGIFWMSCLFLVIVVFEAWLGKLVVDTNLNVLKITAHMLLALGLATIPIVIIHKLKPVEKIQNNRLKWLIAITLLVVVAQIFIGTNVRSQVDDISKSLDYGQRNLWVAQLNGYFDVHKIMAGILSLLCIFVFWQSLSYAGIARKGVHILLVILASVASGLVMANLNMPAFMQPTHLLLSAILFTLLFNLRLYIK